MIAKIEDKQLLQLKDENLLIPKQLDKFQADDRIVIKINDVISFLNSKKHGVTEFSMKGFPFRIRIEVIEDQTSSISLGFYLECNLSKLVESTNWICNLKADFCIRNRTGFYKKETIKQCFNEKNTRFGIDNFVSANQERD